MDAAKAVSAHFALARVVFVSSRKPDGTDALNANSTTNIWRVEADGTDLRAITRATADGAASDGPQWSPDGTKVVFHSSRKLDGTDAPNANRTRNIWRVNADGTDLRAITNLTAAGADSYFPRWSPDGTKVVFSSPRKLDGTDAPNTHGTFNIWRVNADGTDLRAFTNLTAMGADSSVPKWSPDGTKVVFVSQRKLDGSDARNANGTSNIWRMNADGADLRAITNLTANGAGSSAPQWSPDGTTFVFQSSRKLDGSDALNTNGTSNIWRVNADGTDLRPLTKLIAAGADSSIPQWSPDGTKVVFNSSRKLDGSDAPNANRTSNIWRVNADGTELRQLANLTANGAGSYGQQWSPDGTKVVFDSSRKLDGTDAPIAIGPSNIWRVNADGTDPKPLTKANALNADSYDPRFSR
jgi:Tol biopolymer transport system component